MKQKKTKARGVDLVEKMPVSKGVTYCPFCEGVQTHLRDLIYVCAKSHESHQGIDDAEIAKIQQMRANNKVRQQIHIQIGDDEGPHKNLYYELHGIEGDFTVTVFRKFMEWNDIDKREVPKSEKIKRYHGSLHQVMQMLFAHEIHYKQAATLGELLDVLKGIDARLESLSETLFEISKNKD